MVVRDCTPLDAEPSADQQLLQDVPAPVLARAGDDAVGDRQDSGTPSGQPAGSFVFSSSRTSVTVISSSTAFAMS